MAEPNTPSNSPAVEYESPALQPFPPLLRNRNFLLLWAGYVISALGDRIHFLVMLKLLETLKRAHDASFTVVGTQETAPAS